jgi:long-subunit fatty acid transport protein
MYDQGGIVHISLGFGYEVVPDIFVGMSANYATGSYLSDREYFEVDTADTYGSSVQTNPADPLTTDFQRIYVHDVRNTTYSGWDVKVGILYKFYNFIGISASFKAPFRHKISETRNLSGYADYAGGRRVEVAPTETQLAYTTIPAYEATVGAMVNLWILTGTLEATYVDYTQIDFPSGLPLQVRSLAIKEVKEKLTPVVQLNGGAEFRLPFTGLVARAGFMYRPSPLANDPMEFDTKVVTAGFGINSSDRLQFDLGYALGLWTQRGDKYSVDGVTQEVVTHDVLVSMRFRF